MKIYFLIEDITIIGGAERVIVNLSNEIVKHLKYEVNIISCQKKNQDIFYDIDSKIKIIDLNLKKHNKIKTLRKLDSINFEKNSILISVGVWISLLLPILKLKKKIKIVAYEHLGYETIPNHTFKMREISYRFFDSIISLTTKDNDYYKKINQSTYVIPNMVPFKLEKKSNLENKRVISVGRISYQKGYDILIRVYERLAQKYKNWEFIIVGEGNYESEILEKKITQNKNIKIKKFTKNIEKEYLESDIYVMSSRYEGFGMVLIEAMEAGLPCVSTNCPNGPSDIIIDNKNGFLIDMDNDLEKNLEIKIEKLMLEKKLKEKFSENSKKMVEKYYSKEILKKWDELLRKLYKKL